MSEPGQPMYGYGGNPPYGPPPRRNNKNVLIAVAGVVVVAAAAIISIVLLSGSDDTAPAAAGSTASTPSASASASTSSAGGLTCADVQNDTTFRHKLDLHEGGTEPSGVSLPDGAPVLICSGVTTATPAAQVTALAWDNLPLGDYVTRMTATGWKDEATPPYHVLGNPNSKYQIVAVTIHGNLVAVYGHS
jgi:hypothetical protein